MTVLLPAVDPIGTVNWALDGILPLESVVALKGVCAPPKMAKSGEFAAKPCPETVTS